MKMNIIMKKICAATALVLALTATGCLGEAPVAEVTVVAENRISGDLLYTEYSDGTAVLTGHNSPTLTELIVPETVNGLTVTGIGDQAFATCETLVTFRAGKNLKTIGNEAFYACTALETVEFGAHVIDIGYYAFEGTAWMAAQTDDFVVMGDGVLVKYRGNAASVVIPDTVKRISDAFFQNFDLVEVTLGENVEVIGEYAFAYCSELRAVHFTEAQRVIEANAFAFCEKLHIVEIGPNVVEIGDTAFHYCTTLHRLELGESLEVIGADAFAYCNQLTSITVGPALREVGAYAFYDCYILRGVTYSGNSDAWAQISFSDGNDLLLEAPLRCLGK